MLYSGDLVELSRYPIGDLIITFAKRVVNVCSSCVADLSVRFELRDQQGAGLSVNANEPGSEPGFPETHTPPLKLNPASYS